jgi:protein-S-isoprenylcysteine O-methyltransferase Ste14
VLGFAVVAAAAVVADMRIQPWNLIYLAGLAVYIAIRGVFGTRTKDNEKTISRVDWRDRALVGVVFVGNILLPAPYLGTSWLDFADYRLPLFVPWAGTAVMVMALWLFWRAHADLGLNWSITLEMRKGHELVVHGVYRTIRHPMYAAIFLFALAQGALLQNWLAGWGGFVSFAALYLFRVTREEKMMRDFFGESYDHYAKGTGRLWPRLPGRSGR